ncbi:MAG: LamG-like jellyroll fold domain-containing protein [Phycisphaerales bacterium]
MICRNCRLSSLHRPAHFGALLALTTVLPTATAEVSHRYVDIPVYYSTIVDVDEDGVVDFHTDPHSRAGSLGLSGVVWMNGFLFSVKPFGPAFLPLGGLVGPVLEGGSYDYPDLMKVFAIDYGWGWGQGSYSLPLGNHLVGIRFQRDGAVHYGWLGIVVVGSVPWVSATITEIAWESEPDTPIVAGWGDCNGNGLNDVVEILAGADVPDCNGDLVDDDCQPDEDCNGNGVRDLCELGTPGVPDCNGNLIPDACDIAADPTLDCDGDGVLDACQIAADPAVDCDGDGVLDSCVGVPDDCNGNGVSDACEIAYHPERDCDGDGVLDSCVGVPDDCNGDGVSDTCEIAFHPERDCDGDGVLDACQILVDPTLDCNGDGVLDSCQGTPFAGNPSCLLIPDAGTSSFAGALVPGLADSVPPSEITIEFWQRISKPGPQRAVHTDWYDWSDVDVCNVYYEDGSIHWEFGSVYAPESHLSYRPSVALAGAWQHFAVEASSAGQFMRIYRNGVLEAEKSGAGAFTPNNQIMRLGATHWEQPAGKIDEVRIWNHARTAAQIQQFMGGTVDPASPGLVAYWRFDEGAGLVAKDLAGAQDAYLYGPVEWAAALSCPLSPDLDGDGTVGAGDLGILLGAWGPARPGSVADLNADGIVDGADLGVLLSQWG